jgi:hypothetical protein
MECFCWDDVPIVQRAGLVETHEFDMEHGERLDRMYPGDVFRHLGCEQGKRYRFTVSVEAVYPQSLQRGTNADSISASVFTIDPPLRKKN